jgi:hypothetical protein
VDAAAGQGIAGVAAARAVEVAVVHDRRGPVGLGRR